MTLGVGTHLGPYEIRGFIGAGGMGEVYKARDARLDRTVAIKVLPTNMSGDPERRARFEREAKTIAGLSHPHICTLHDVGEYAGSLFLVMEYLVGETFAHRLAKGPFPIDQAMAIAIEIADALSAAHRQGVIHRDLKPGNVMLTRGGAKLLDFGLAKLTGQGDQAAAALVSAPTRSAPLTAEGVLVGTLQYMAPEQLEGKPVDARCDLWAFGAIVYEMVTGRRAFAGASAASLIGSILAREPESMLTLQPLTTPALERLVRKCLRKDPDARWQGSADLADELRWLTGDDLNSASEVALHAAPRARWQVGLWVAGVLLATLGSALLLWRPTPPEAPRVSMRLTVTLPGDMPLAPPGLVSPAHDRPALALSPDGSRLAYVALRGGKTQICLRDMRSGILTALEDTTGGHTPFFSPDGTWIGFFADNKLKKITVSGGAAFVLADAPYPWGGTWGSDDTIYFNRYEGEGVFSVPASGGAVRPLVSGPGGMPETVGGNRGLLITGVRYIDLRKPSEARPVVRGARARYLSSGHLIYSAGSRLMAIPVDATMAPTGNPLILAEDVRTAPYGVAQFTVSDEGTLVYVSGRPQNLASFVWVDRQGRSQPLDLPEAKYGAYALSPDGTRLAYGLDRDIWIWDRVRRTASQLTPRAASGTPALNRYPRWTPDATTVIYESIETGVPPRLMAARVDGSTAPSQLWAPKSSSWSQFLYPMGFSPDRSILSFFATGPDSSFDLYLLRLSRSGGSLAAGQEPETFLATPFGEVFGGISPDGQWMLFASDRSGAYEIWMTTYPKAEPLFKLSTAGGREAMWNAAVPDEVVYLNGRSMYAVDVSRGPANPGKPKFLFDGAYPDTEGLGYDMAPDGRFLMLENKDILKPTTTITVVTNLVDELRRQLPPAKK